jgi:uncharacterized damage-inducible protein DinB
MIDIGTLRILAKYNDWADQTLFAAMAKLPGDTIYAKSKTLFGSMVGTLNHNYQVDLIWQAHLSGEEHGFKSRRDLLHARFEDLTRAQGQANRWFIDWVERQTPAALSETLHFKFTSGEPAQMQRGAMFLHVINHKTYHRGWVSEQFFGVGAKPPETDLSVYLTRVELASASTCEPSAG